MRNEMKLEFDSRSCNESFARVTVAAFLTQLNPTFEEVADVKTAVSEAVTNAIIHGYEGSVGKITITCTLQGGELSVCVHDDGKGIADIARAMEPMFTTKAECDRAGMGFAFMEAFMDSLEVESEPGHGTTVRMTKRVAHAAAGGRSVDYEKAGDAADGRQANLTDNVCAVLADGTGGQKKEKADSVCNVLTDGTNGQKKEKADNVCAALTDGTGGQKKEKADNVCAVLTDGTGGQKKVTDSACTVLADAAGRWGKFQKERL